MAEISSTNTAKRGGTGLGLSQLSGDGVSLAGLQLPWETWHSYFLRGDKVGYSHVISAIDEDGDGVNVRTQITDQILLRRGSSTLIQSLDQSNIEARDGSLISFASTLRIGPARTRYEGRTTVEQLTIDTIRGSTRQSETIPWSYGNRGFAGVQQTLLAKPLRLDDRRRLTILVPIQNQTATVELKCIAKASIATLDGEVHDALEIDVKMSVGDASPIESTIWVKSNGELLKSHMPALELTAIRTTKEEATSEIADPIDVLAATAIRSRGGLNNQQETYRCGYMLTPRQLADGKTAGGKTEPITITPQPGQWFRKLENGSVQLIVSRDPAEPERAGFTGANPEPDEADTASGPIIDSQSPDVAKLASLSKATDPLELALDLTRTVKQLISPGDYSRGFASASQTARDGVGDCTERAVLLAAMLRSRSIPARVAAGLVYVGSADQPTMAYHMWTLAWIDQRWVALDPTTGGLGAADRITLANSSLADGNEYTCVVPILGVLGKVEIEIANAIYKPLN